MTSNTLGQARAPAAGRTSIWPFALAGVLFALIVFALIRPQWTPAPVGALVEALTGANPRPIRLITPPAGRLSTLARLGRQVFYDETLSASGRQSCASCHSPSNAYGPPNDRAVQFGGAHMLDTGLRAPPSLAYLYRQPPFSIGPDPGETDSPVPLNQLAARQRGGSRAAKVAGAQPAAPAVVPQGGLFWDGRSDTLQAQGLGPMMDPAEMANVSEADVARKLAKAPYRDQFKPLFGPDILTKPTLLVAEAMSAVARYQIEDPSFHRFDSKYDAWLQGRARLTQAERRGLKLFNDPARANCGGCHLSQPTPDGLPPLFTDTQYEALGVPRNPAIPANRNPGFFDLGLCGPVRRDLSAQTQYCAMFLTPTLRNVARRPVFFHNGRYRSLSQVLDFYALRDTDPGRIYPHDASGRVDELDDIPVRYRGNLDRTDAPFNHRAGDPPALTPAERGDIIAFLRTLDDGYPARGR